MNKYHDRHGHFARAPMGFWGGFVWVMLISGCLVFWALAFVGLDALLERWMPTETVAVEDEFMKANKPIFEQIETDKLGNVWLRKTIENGHTYELLKPAGEKQGCFTGESIDEIARMIREGDDVGAIRKLTGRKHEDVCEHLSIESCCLVCLYKSDILKLKRTISLMVSAAGHPDAKIGCRHVVEIGRAALKECGK